MKPKIERRMQHEKREQVEQAITEHKARGYEVTGRDPLKLTRDRHVIVLDNGFFKEGSRAAIAPQLTLTQQDISALNAAGITVKEGV